MPDNFLYDLSFSSESIETDAGLRTYITLSLLTKGRARPEDEAPDPSDLGGWWGDTYSEVPNYRVGSRLWTLVGRSITPALLSSMEQMIREALQWLVDDGYVGSWEIELEIIRHGMVGARIGVRRPLAQTVTSLGLWELSI